MKSFLSLAFTVIVFYACSHSQESYVNDGVELGKLVDSLSIEPNEIYIHIDKSDYRLSVMVDSLVIKQYPVVFGGNPADDKLRQGDKCTPEGEFKVISKYPHKSWDKFIWIDYPNDASWAKHQKAKREGRIETSDGIGGEIGIHGVPKGTDFMIDQRINWTLGCISLKNEHVNEIYPYLDKGSMVIIQK
jgi:murein L,D-transpeptidase YafK